MKVSRAERVERARAEQPGQAAAEPAVRHEWVHAPCALARARACLHASDVCVYVGACLLAFVCVGTWAFPHWGGLVAIGRRGMLRCMFQVTF